MRNKDLKEEINQVKDDILLKSFMEGRKVLEIKNYAEAKIEFESQINYIHQNALKNHELIVEGDIVAQCHLYIAFCYIHLEKWNDAMKQIDFAINLAKNEEYKENFQEYAIQILYQCAQNDIQNKKYNEGLSKLTLLESKLKTIKSSEVSAIKGNIYFCIGICYVKKEDFDQAIIYLQKAENSTNDIQLKKIINEHLNILIKNREMKEAEKLLSPVIEKWKKITQKIESLNSGGIRLSVYEIDNLKDAVLDCDTKLQEIGNLHGEAENIVNTIKNNIKSLKKQLGMKESKKSKTVSRKSEKKSPENLFRALFSELLSGKKDNGESSQTDILLKLLLNSLLRKKNENEDKDND